MRLFSWVTWTVGLLLPMTAWSQNIGDSCTANGQCEAPFCIEGVCCNMPCGEGVTTDCLVCSVQAGGPMDGICEIANPETVCRAAAGPCDVTEFCVGEDSFCPEDALREPGEACGAVENPCAMGGVCNGESPECPSETSVLDGTPCPGGVCIASQCIPDPDPPGNGNGDAGMPNDGSDTGGSPGDPMLEGGGICSSKIAMNPIETPLAQSFLVLLLLGFARAFLRWNRGRSSGAP